LRSFIVFSVLSLAGAAAPAQELKNQQEETLYALGAILGHRVAPFHLTPRELELVKRGFTDSAMNRKLKLDEPDLEEWGPKVDAMMAKRTTPELEAQRAKGSAFAEAAAREPGAIRTPSGIVIRTLKPGSGPSPAATSKVKVNYTGKLIDGTVFDASDKHGGPAEFPLKGVIACWTEGVQRMKVGETARLVCPSALAYGPQGRPPQIAGGAWLVFDIELLGVTP
jgi:FKBP-type peptidyl-prolyl cis-trans isomerase FkpA